LRLLAKHHPTDPHTAGTLFKLLEATRPVAMAARFHLFRQDPQQLAQAVATRADEQSPKKLFETVVDRLGTAGAYPLLLLLAHQPKIGKIALETMLDRLGQRASERIHRALAHASPETRSSIRRELQIHKVRYFQKASELIRRRDSVAYRSEILQLFTRVLGLDPTLKEAHLSRGRMRQTGLDGQIYGKGADLSGALADFSALLRIDPQFVPAIYERAGIHLAREEYKQALKDVRLLQQTRQDDPVLLFLAGRLYYHLKRYPEAVASLSGAIPKLEDGPNRQLAMHFLSRSHSHQGQHARAIAIARLLIEKARNTAALLDLGDALARAGEKKHAAAVYREILSNPSSREDPDRRLVSG
jgi:tetratricopeptide (TPR) repeat protein